MGIRFYCPNGHKLNVKQFQSGMKGICPYCGAKIQIPAESTRPSSKKRKAKGGIGVPRVERGGSTPVAPPSGNAGGASSPGSPLAPAVAAAPVAPSGAPVQPPASTPVQPAGHVPTAGAGQLPAAATSPPGAPEQSAPVIVPGDAPGVPPAGSSPPVSATVSAAAPTASAAPAPSDLTDPLAEAGDVVWYVRPPSGGQFGPAGGEVMRTWIGEGRVSADSLVWREGWRDWREAADVFPQLGAGRVEPPLGGVTAGATSTTAAIGAAPSSLTRSRRQSRTTQMIIITVLILSVIILSVVFVLVLTGAIGAEVQTTTGVALAAVVRLDSIPWFSLSAARSPSPKGCP